MCFKMFILLTQKELDLLRKDVLNYPKFCFQVADKYSSYDKKNYIDEIGKLMQFLGFLVFILCAQSRVGFYINGILF